MAVTSDAGARTNGAGLEVNVSLDDARVRIRAATALKRHAMDESGRLSIHATGRTLAVLRYAERLINETKATSQVITPSVEQHLHDEQEAFLRHIERVQENARQRISSLADWTPPNIGLLERIFRKLGLYLLRQDDIAEDEYMRATGSVGNGAHTKGSTGRGATAGGNGTPGNRRRTRPGARNGSVGGYSHKVAGARRNEACD